MYPRTIIDSLPAVPNRDQLTHKDLHAHFSTGQSILLSGSGRDKKYGYRNGIQTDLGDIRNDVWLDLVRELIVRSHEEDLFDKLPGVGEGAHLLVKDESRTGALHA